MKNYFMRDNFSTVVVKNYTIFLFLLLCMNAGFSWVISSHNAALSCLYYGAKIVLEDSLLNLLCIKYFFTFHLTLSDPFLGILVCDVTVNIKAFQKCIQWNKYVNSRLFVKAVSVI